ncbi:MAG: hypothetical protein EBS01_08020 [Verrucomicrobia bacterium]|nr:hypothetical protein [Verrucomicrobiota bacterium]
MASWLLKPVGDLPMNTQLSHGTEIANPIHEASGLPEKIHALASSIGKNMFISVKNIDGINSQSRLLSLNARIEAARAGEAGRSFSIVATEMVDLSSRTRKTGRYPERIHRLL